MTATATPQPTTTPTQSPTVTETPTVVPTPVPGGSNLIQNGDFESGVDPWPASSSGGYELVDTKNPHAGQYSAYLCGYSGCNDIISQSFTVPTGGNSLTIDYWWQGQTNRTTQSCRDTLSVLVLNSNGQKIGQLQQSCNTNANGQWQEVRSDVSTLLTNYSGQNVTLVFSAHTTVSLSTTAFFVDDVVVQGA